MKIPKYWAKGMQTALAAKKQMVAFSCWHWSDVSIEDAKQKADARAYSVIQRLLHAEKLDRYSYGDRPLREETIQTLVNRTGQEIAIVTRNAYGAVILNTASAMFIDIDFPKEKPGKNLIAQLFGKQSPKPEEVYCQKIEDWWKKHPELSLRVYRTYAGLRCLITNEIFEPGQRESMEILHDLGSDPLYIRLCKAQECYRARLTAKPWRCRIGKPPARYPWENRDAEAIYRKWESRYSATAAQYAACRLVKAIGPVRIHPDIDPILRLHDKMACSDFNLELA